MTTIEATMKSNIIDITNETMLASAAEQAVAVLRGGGLVVAPTETKYGLITRADDQSALEKMYKLKERGLDKPVAMLLSSVSEIPQIGISNKFTEILAEEFLPGPLTLVVNTDHKWLPPRIVGGKIGLRISSEPFIAELLEKSDFPLCATSANKSGQNELDCVEEIESIFRSYIDQYIDSGARTGSVSTVIDCSLDQPVILREGSISKSKIMTVLERLN